MFEDLVTTMATATDQTVLFVGRPSPWLDSAAAHLRGEGFVVWSASEIDKAVALVRDDQSISCTVLAESLPREPWLDGLARMVMARPNMPVIVLAAAYDPGAMVRYLQLGRQSSGASLVSYYPNDYDYHGLFNLISGVCSVPDQLAIR
jgi:DNA-binding NtrC family response regulator